MALKTSSVFGKVKGAGQVVVDAANGVMKDAGEKVEVSKINGKIADINRDIQKLYAVIGERIYKDGAESIQRGAFEEIAQIDALHMEIEGLRARSAELRDMILCGGCGRECLASDEFCAKCGTKLEK